MHLKLFLIGTNFGILMPQKPAKLKSEELENPEDDLPETNEFYGFFPEELLVPATSAETHACWQELLKSSIFPSDCYWLAVPSEAVNGLMPILHFGIRKFFSGRVAFDWSRNGGKVYLIQ